VKVTDQKPSAALRDYVSAYKLIESDGHIMNQLLPDTSMALAFRLHGDVRQLDRARLTLLPECTVTGLRSAMREIQYDAGAKTLVVLLNPKGASHLFREPLHQFFNQMVSLGDIDGSGVKELYEQLLDAPSFIQQVNVVEGFLLKRINGDPGDPIVDEALRRIDESRGLLRIKALSGDLCLSQDAFEKRFRRGVGASPKQYANIVRLRAIVQKRPTELTQIVYDFDFYDPAHFSKSFKLFTGKTPTEFFRSPSFW
jgi:AraC-like DNA-binding protein